MDINDYQKGPLGPLSSKAGLCDYLDIGLTSLNEKIKRKEIPEPDVVLGPRLARYSHRLRERIIADHLVTSEGE
jgi:hypothetical protein